MQSIGTKGTLGSKPHSTTRSFDTRSTSCDREEFGLELSSAKSPKKSRGFDTKAPHFFTSLGKGARKRSRVEEEDQSGIEPVMEEEENDVKTLWLTSDRLGGRHVQDETPSAVG